MWSNQNKTDKYIISQFKLCEIDLLQKPIKFASAGNGVGYKMGLLD